MKHNAKITAILIIMFLITQLIGLAVINFYQDGHELPYGMEPPLECNDGIDNDKDGMIDYPEDNGCSSSKDLSESEEEGLGYLRSILVAFAFAILIFFLLTKIKAERFIRLWFFVVTTIALGLSFNVILFKFSFWFIGFIPLIIGLPLAYIKIFKRNLLVHNFTELLIYPGIAAVFVPILGVLGIIILLLAISLYDIWAVWQSKIMQKMAKYQITKLKFFTGFFVPYASKRQKQKIKLLKQKYKNKSEKAKENAFKRSKIKVNLAILGGGDVIFPIITAGVFYKVYGLIPSLIITASATIGLFALFAFARKGKFYPAMPFITIAMYLGMITSWLIF